MENFGNLREKYCACCSKRLDKIPRRDVRRISDSSLLNNLNTVTPIILTNKQKIIDQTIINIGDLICGSINFHYIIQLTYG